MEILSGIDYTLFLLVGVAENLYDCEDNDSLEDVPPPPPPPVSLQGYMQQPPATSSFPQHPTNMMAAQPTFNQHSTQTYPVGIPGAGQDPSLQQYNYQHGPGQPHSAAAGPPTSSAYHSPPPKSKSSKKSHQQGYSNKKYKHH